MLDSLANWLLFYPELCHCNTWRRWLGKIWWLDNRMTSLFMSFRINGSFTNTKLSIPYSIMPLYYWTWKLEFELWLAHLKSTTMLLNLVYVFWGIFFLFCLYFRFLTYTVFTHNKVYFFSTSIQTVILSKTSIPGGNRYWVLKTGPENHQTWIPSMHKSLFACFS